MEKLTAHVEVRPISSSIIDRFPFFQFWRIGRDLKLVQVQGVFLMAGKTNLQPPTMTIGPLSEQTRCNLETIRYYERIGIMPQPPRTEGGHRVYREQHLKRLPSVSCYDRWVWRRNLESFRNHHHRGGFHHHRFLDAA